VGSLTLHYFDAVHWAFIELERLGYVVHNDDDTWTVTNGGHQAAANTLLGMRQAERLLVIMSIGSAGPVGLDTG
jgi:Mn-dependent DtxR family transcriptional regulator